MYRRSNEGRRRGVLLCSLVALLGGALLGGAWWAIGRARIGGTAAPLTFPTTVAVIDPVALILARDGDDLTYRLRCTAAAENLAVAVRWEGPQGSVEGRWNDTVCIPGRELGAGEAEPLAALPPGERAAVTMTVTLEASGRRQRTSTQQAFLLGEDGLLREVVAGGVSAARDKHGNRWWVVP